MTGLPRFQIAAAALCAALVSVVPLACNSTSPEGSGVKDSTCTSACGTSDTGTLVGSDPGSNPLGTQNGIAIGIGDHVYKLGASNVDRYPPAGKRLLYATYSPPLINGRADTSSFNGARVLNASLFLKPVIGAQTCAEGDSISLFASGTGPWTGTYMSTACSVQVDYMTATGGMAGKILSASLKNANGKVLKITNAQFSVYQHLGLSGTAPTLATDSSFHITMTVDSGTFELKQGNYFRMDSSGPVYPGGASVGYAYTPDDGTKLLNRISLFIANLSNLAGTHVCGETFSGGTTKMEVWLGTYQSEYAFYAGKYGSGVVGSCSITVPSNNSNRGSYTATLVVYNPADTVLLPYSQRRIVIHGEFRK